MGDANQTVSEELKISDGGGMDIPLSDAFLLDALVSDLGRVAAAEGLGMNHRTTPACYAAGPNGADTSNYNRSEARVAVYEL